MPYTQHFIVHGKPLGTALRKPKQVHEELQAPTSYAFFCPHCAELWARCPVVATVGGRTEIWQVFRMACRACPSYSYQGIAGSMLLNWDEPFNNSFPLEVLRREFQLHLDSLPQELQ